MRGSALEGKSVPQAWWAACDCRFPPADFLYHNAPNHRSEISITGSSIAVRGAVGIGGRSSERINQFLTLDFALEGIPLLGDLTDHSGRAALKRDLLSQRTWRVGERPFTAHFQSMLLKATAFVMRRADQALTTFP